MSKQNPKEEFKAQINDCVQFFFKNLTQESFPIRIFTHYDTDGLCSGAILSSALFRQKIPYHLKILKQLDKSSIEKISNDSEITQNFLVFSDFGSGQYHEIEKHIQNDQYIILDHHLPQHIDNKEMSEEINKLKEKSLPYHINPYFAGIDGSIEISSAGICYLFAKNMKSLNSDLSPLAIIAALGDLQNQGPNGSFLGLNSDILSESIAQKKVEIKTDLNFSSIKPLNEAIAYSSEIHLPGLSQRVDVSLNFLKKTGVLIEKPDGELKALNDFNWEEKKKLSSAIIKYAIDSCGLDPTEITGKLIVNKYIFEHESRYPELLEAIEFSNLLNSCGKTGNASIGIAIAMGDRNKSMVEAKEVLKNYRYKLKKSVDWILDKHKLHKLEFIQYFYGEDEIPEEIVGNVCSSLLNSQLIDKTKPIFGYADKIGENFYKVSSRTTLELINTGVNLAEVIKIALKLTNLDSLGGGHPPAAGTKIKKDVILEFLFNCNKIVKKQLSWKR